MCISTPVSTKTVHQELQRFNIHGGAAIAKPLITRANAKRWFQWCQQQKSWAVDNVKHVLFPETLVSPPSLSFPHLGELQCWEAPKKLTTRTVTWPEWSMVVDQWWIGLPLHGIPQVQYLCWMGASLPRSSEPFWRTMCTQWFKHCTLKVVPCIRMIMHQYTQQDVWQSGLMNMKVKLNIFHGQHSHQILILLSHFGVFWRSESGNVFLHQHHVVTWPRFCEWNGSKSLWPMYRTCICHCQDELMLATKGGPTPN